MSPSSEARGTIRIEFEDGFTRPAGEAFETFKKKSAEAFDFLSEAGSKSITSLVAQMEELSASAENLTHNLEKGVGEKKTRTLAESWEEKTLIKDVGEGIAGMETVTGVATVVGLTTGLLSIASSISSIFKPSRREGSPLSLQPTDPRPFDNFLKREGLSGFFGLGNQEDAGKAGEFLNSLLEKINKLKILSEDKIGFQLEADDGASEPLSRVTEKAGVVRQELDSLAPVTHLAVELEDRATDAARGIRAGLEDLFGSPLVQEVRAFGHGAAPSLPTGSPFVSAPELNLEPQFGAGDFSGFLGSFASGLDRVPRDGMAFLHRDEAVLNAREAERFRSGGTSIGNVSIAISGEQKNPRQIAREIRAELLRLNERMES
ncbi:MAG: hypothetical protein COV67_09035 [Nitrospinae bacterium CG11_big_fil_rev_8_21_14_0_20_56_8]|nr:MAG: hypothetical protein COV67_09035 [Nitrospinae bacterium CG11_big_fil_rev_8_21_14_0_20_56_8]